MYLYEISNEREKHIMDKSQRNKILYHALVTFIALATSILFFFLLYRFAELNKIFGKLWKAISPFVYGTAIAYVLNPACNFFEGLFLKALGKARLTKPDKAANGLSVAVSLLMTILIIYFLIATLIPQLIDSITGLVNSLPGYVNDIQKWAEEKLADQPEILMYLENAIEKAEDYFNNWITDTLLPNIQTILGGLTSSVATVFSILKNFFLSFIVAAYILIGRRKLVAKFKMLLKSVFKPHQFDIIWEEMKFTDRMFSGFISGKIIDSAIIGMITFVVLSIWNMIAGFDYVLLISVVIGVTNIIPFFGPFIGAIPCAFLILLGSPMKCLGFIVFIVILQQVDGNILGPKILGNTTGISSFGVLFSVLFFGNIWGFVGMLIGVPLFGVMSDIAGKFMVKGLRKHDQSELADAYLQSKAQELEAKAKEQETHSSGLLEKMKKKKF